MGDAEDWDFVPECEVSAVVRAVAANVQQNEEVDRTSLAVLLEAQASLQRESFQDIYALKDEERIEFIRWNVLALEDELHEMLGECGWKPWATSRHINPTPALMELVDALHFFMNLVIAVAGYDEADMPVAPHELGEALANLYFQKRAKNAQRQADGYDGVTGKCVNCHRDVTDSVNTITTVSADGAVVRFCICGKPVPPQ